MAENRVTQLGIETLSMVGLGGGNIVTQIGIETLELTSDCNPVVPTRAVLTSKVHRFATCWKIERTDGVILRFTDHDGSLVVGTDTYAPMGGVNASARQRQSELQPRNLTIQGSLSSAAITHTDLRAGRYRNARITETKVDWRYPWKTAYSIDVYWVQSVKFNGESWEALIGSSVSRLMKPCGQQYGRLCRADLGDGRCKIDLVPLTVSKTVSAVTQQRLTFTSNITGKPDDYYTGGSLTWTTGANAGIVSEVKAYQSASGVVSLQLRTPFDIVAADVFSIVAGCDKLWTTCLNKFNNLDNFRAEPFMPGMDKMLETPNGL